MLRLRKTYIALVAFIAILLSLISLAYWTTRQADERLEARLIGRWGVYPVDSPASDPPKWILELRANGRMSNHYPDGKILSDDSMRMPNLDIQWWIRYGYLVIRRDLDLPPGSVDGVEQRVDSVWTDKYELSWLDDNSLTMSDSSDDDISDTLLLRRLPTSDK